MPYAIYSKRTGIINRIVDDLDTLLDSESMLEIDEDVNFQREYPSIIEGQDINTMGFPLFMDSNGLTTFKPQATAYDAQDRPYPVKNVPIYVAPTTITGDPLTQRSDLSIASHPFAWTVSEAAAVKYEAILARNAPFNVVIGEEFIDEEHIDGTSSSGYVLSEGQLWLAPGGVLVSEEFQFKQTSYGNMDIDESADRDARQYVFDTYWFSPEPDPPEGMDFYWQGRRWDTGAILGGGTTYYPMTLNDEMPTTPLGEGASASIVCYGIRIKIINNSTVTLNLENYQLLLRIRNLP